MQCDPKKSLFVIYVYTLLVCLFDVGLYPINVKTAEPIGPKFFVGARVTQRKVINDRIFKYLPLTKYDF